MIKLLLCACLAATAATWPSGLRALKIPAWMPPVAPHLNVARWMHMPHILEPIGGPTIDDARHYLKPGITATELLRGRGYLVRSFTFTTRDGYTLTMLRARNPLAPPISSKLPLLFINPATVSSAGYLVNSAGVKPRLHVGLKLDQLGSMEEIREHLADEPAIKSLPFLALNLGYECWFMTRRGFEGPRKKRGHEKRTLRDAWRAVPEMLLNHLLDGSFSKDAKLDPKRPIRAKTHARDPTLANKNQTIQIEAGKPEVKTQELAESQRAKVVVPAPSSQAQTSAQRNLLLPPAIAAPLTILNLMVMIAKLPGALKRMGDIRLEFIETFDPEFWRFSLDEQVEFDVPDAIDFVLEKTGKRKLHTVSLSCGGAVTLLALAREPQLARKISRAVMWAPSVNLGSKSASVYSLSKLIPLLQNYAGPIPFVFLVREVQYWMQKICALDIMQRTLCASAFDAVGGFSGGQAPFRPFMAAVFMTPTSTNELIHLAQMARSQRPCKFSFPTSEENLRVYGSERPPCYDLGRIELANISFYVGAYDTLVSPDDIATTGLQMRTPSELHIIKGERLYFNHFGFLIHKNTAELAIIPSMLDIERSEAAEQRGGGRPNIELEDLSEWTANSHEQAAVPEVESGPADMSH